MDQKGRRASIRPIQARNSPVCGTKSWQKAREQVIWEAGQVRADQADEGDTGESNQLIAEGEERSRGMTGKTVTP